MSTSYGIICFNPKNQKTLVVQRTHTPEFLHLMRGNFNRADLDIILERSTREEHDLLRSILLSNNNICYDIYAYLSKSFNFSHFKNKKDYLTRIAIKSRDQLKLHHDDIIEYLNNTLPRMETEWLWPKGHLMNDESNIECSIRETFEETGYRFNINQLLRSNGVPVTFNIDNHVFYNKTYTTVYYIIVLDQEPEYHLQPINEQEIKKVSWMNCKDLFDRLPNKEYQQLLLKLYDTIFKK